MSSADLITRIPNGRIDRETTANVGTISGGRATNIVAEQAACVLEVRSLDRRKMEAQEAQIRDTAKKDRGEMGRPLLHQAHSRILGLLDQARGQDRAHRLGRDGARRHLPSFEVSGGGSDTNILNRAGISAINLSAGMRNVHSTKEYVMVRDLVNGTMTVLSIIEIAG